MASPARTPSQTPPMSQFAYTPSVGGNFSTVPRGPRGVTLSSVNPNELTSFQLGQLQRSDNPLVQHVSNNARLFASARGAGLHGSQYADSATRAAFDQMTPIAAADAGQYADVRNRNQDALNEENITGLNNANAIDVANVGAGASMANAAANIAEQRRQFDIDQGNRAENRAWQLADANTSARASQRSQVFDTMMSTIFSDPSYWRDPEGALGMINTYSSNIDQLMADLFPEYFETDQQGNEVQP